MTAYQHILFATDLTKESNAVGDRAFTIAKKYGAKLSIAHIFSYSPMLYAGGEFAAPIETDVNKTLLEQAKKELAQQGARLGIAVENQWMETGFAKTAVAQLAQQHEVDLIVVGSHSRHGLALLLGSTANSTLHLMHCDVLAVHL